MVSINDAARATRVTFRTVNPLIVKAQTYFVSMAQMALMALIPQLVSAGSSSDWTYSGPVGPAHWAQLDPQFSVCGSGAAQSPINIEQPANAAPSAKPLEFHYQPALLDITNTGHAVQVNLQPESSSITLGDQRYSLLQFHFHIPAEERFHHHAAFMDAHFVHRSQDGKYLVVAVQFQIGTVRNAAIQEIIDYAPHQKGAQYKASDVQLDLLELLPANHAYDTYEGSLTTPPCTQGVTWIELTTPVTITSGQLDAMGRFYKGNQRPVQPFNGRKVYQVTDER
ncbi:carbonic anhydrase [Paraburkholderia sediminicola]|uniref:carbonic anhydrase n=1 Tax=Paraburkholderia sediminicola TaxID=458836 RepID=UPI0038B9F4E1